MHRSNCTCEVCQIVWYTFTTVKPDFHTKTTLFFHPIISAAVLEVLFFFMLHGNNNADLHTFLFRSLPTRRCILSSIGSLIFPFPSFTLQHRDLHARLREPKSSSSSSFSHLPSHRAHIAQCSSILVNESLQHELTSSLTQWTKPHCSDDGGDGVVVIMIMNMTVKFSSCLPPSLVIERTRSMESALHRLFR